MNQATIQIIDNIISIPGADKIELAHVLGWQCVVEKGKFKAGQKAIYVQIDTLLPYRSHYAFLEKSSPFKEYSIEYGEDVVPGVKYTRLKTAKFLGNISQGLLLSMDDYNLEYDAFESGADVSDSIGAIKYNKPVSVSLKGSAKGSFPYFIRKTDEERIQNISGRLNEFDGRRVYASLKIDGTSVTYYYLIEEDEFGVCSRNMTMLEDGGSLYAQIAKRHNIKEKLKAYCLSIGKSIAVQGEIAGPSVQGNRLKLPTQTLYLFTVQQIDKQKEPIYLSFDYLVGAKTALDVDTVPIMETFNFNCAVHTKDKLLEDAISLGNDMEGFVIRTIDELPDPPRGLNRWSFKVINNNYKD